MIKRIISIFGVMIVTIAIFIPIVNAQTEFIVSPDNDEQPLYEILGSTEYSGPKNYTIYGYNAKSIFKPTYLVPLVRTFFGDPSEMSNGTYEYNLYSTKDNSHRSYLQLNIYDNISYTLKYCIENLSTGVSGSWFICSLISVNADICLYAENDGIIYMVPYDTATLEIIPVDNYTNTALKVYFYGDLYLYGQAPNDEDIQDAYNRGLEEGYTDGYTEGFADGKPSQEVYDQYYEAGKTEGEEIGYNKGYSDGATSDNAAVYAKGIEKGQEDANLVGSAINGFFNGMKGFFEPFLSIGFGSMTLFNLLGVIVVVVVVILIVKITRG